MELFEEYEKNYADNVYESLNEYVDKINKPCKISGNIFAHTLRKNIYDIVKSKYYVSAINSYIKGSNIEWDLLILKKEVKKEKDINVYSPENVVCSLEFKTSGANFGNNEEIKNYIKKYIDEIKRINKKYHSNIRYGYISLCEKPANLEILDKNFPNNCFWVIRGYYGSRNKLGTKNKNDLKIFIENLIEF